MNAVKLGALLTFVGFLGVGYTSIYAASASPASAQDAAQITKNVGTAQGMAWIVVGIGLAMAFLGLSMDLHDLKTRSPPHLTARKVPKAEPEFACSDCDGDISENDKVCPHCGAPIEGEEAVE